MVRDVCAAGMAGVRNLGFWVGDKISHLRERFGGGRGGALPVEQVCVHSCVPVCAIMHEQLVHTYNTLST